MNAKILIETLTLFGLNPQEWTLAGDVLFDKILLINKYDPEFKLLGEKGPRGWRRLEVLSL